MKKGEKMSEERKAAHLASLAAGRENKKLKTAAEKIAVMFSFVDKVEPTKAVTASAESPALTNGHLDIADPFKWQMKIRMFIQQMSHDDAEAWMEGFRVSFQVAAISVRDLVLRNATSRCFICAKPFPDGRPAGEAGYYDGDRNYIKVYCCHNAEYSSLLLKCQEKEQAVAAWQTRADKAAQQAMIDARSAARKSMPA